MRTTGSFPSMHVCSGDTLGSTIVVRGVLHILVLTKVSLICVKSSYDTSIVKVYMTSTYCHGYSVQQLYDYVCTNLTLVFHCFQTVRKEPRQYGVSFPT